MKSYSKKIPAGLDQEAPSPLSAEVTHAYGNVYGAVIMMRKKEE